jgi:hypothetical protein
MAISINYLTRVISIPKADLTLVQSTPFEIRELDIDSFRLELKDIEDSVGGVPFVDTHRHNTAVNVGGVTLARVVEIINGYTVTFEDGNYAVNLSGANSNIGDVVNLNQVQIRSANSAGLVSQTTITEEVIATRRLVEGLRPSHSATGQILYWNPVDGNDTNDGRTPANAVATFAKAHDLAIDYNHDLIICIPGNNTGQTVSTENIEITKNWLFVRGPGTSFKIQPTSANANGSLVSMAGTVGVQITGLVLDGSSVAGNGIVMEGESITVSRLTIQNITGTGIISSNCHDNFAEFINIMDVTGDGISLSDCIHFTANNIDINGATNGFRQIASGVGLSGEADLNHVRIANTTTGLNIGTNVYETHIHDTVDFSPTTITQILDNGTDTFNGLEIAAKRVWNTVLANHLTAGTTGKALNDAGAAGNPWSTSVTGNTDPGTFGELVGNKLLTVAKFLGLK